MHSKAYARMVLLVAALMSVMTATPAFAGVADEVNEAALAWVEAFNSHDPDRVMACYDPGAVFWGTTSPIMRDTPEAIREYFQSLPSRPQVSISMTDMLSRVYGDIGISTGTYTVSDVRDGKRVSIPARFSFTFRKTNGKWLILDHHSSAVPAPPR